MIKIENTTRVILEMISFLIILTLGETFFALVCLKLFSNISYLGLRLLILIPSLVFIFILCKRWKIDFKENIKAPNFAVVLLVLSISFLGFIIRRPILQPHISVEFVSVKSFISPCFDCLAKEPLRMTLLIILCPIVEEFLFRGLIQKQLSSQFSPLWSIIFTSIIFSISHYNLDKLILCFLTGLLLGLIYTRYNNIWLCIIAHLALNLFSNIYPKTQNGIQIIDMIMCAVSFFVFAYLLLKFKFLNIATKTKYINKLTS